MIIAVDFDGVISFYDHWKGKGVFGAPVKGCQEALSYLKEQGHTIIVYTCRLEIDKVQEYLLAHGVPFDYINYNPDNYKQMLHPAKIVADVYIDDRGVCFQGQWDKEFVSQIVNFKPWGKKV